MLKMDKVAAIRHAVLVAGFSRRRAAREFGASRETVARYLDGAEAGVREPVARPSPTRDAAREALGALLAAQSTMESRKQRLTARRAHELLEGRGVQVGYTVVKELMAERRRRAREVYVPLEYPAGDLAEVDFFEVDVIINGEPQVAWLFVMRLMSSGRDFCWLYPRQDQGCFLDGHIRAFEAFGAVPTRCAYDNLKAAVQKILVGSERQLTTRFAALATHFVFEPCFCRPYEGHDKGGVESRGKNIRLQSMVPVPSGTSLDDVSAAVLADVDKRFAEKADSAALWAAELEGMHGLPGGRFDARKVSFEVPVSSSSTVYIDGSTYSVSTSWARSHVTTYAGVHEVEVRWRGESLTRRRVPKGQRDIDYAAHYLAELAKKPQAVRQVADKLVAQLGGEFPSFWRRLVDDHGAKEASRQMARVLRGVIELGRDECERRVSAALSVGDAVATALLVSTAASPDVSSDFVVPASLDVFVASSSVAHFDALLSIGGVQ